MVKKLKKYMTNLFRIYTYSNAKGWEGNNSFRVAEQMEAPGNSPGNPSENIPWTLLSITETAKLT